MSFERNDWNWDQALVHPAVNYPSSKTANTVGDAKAIGLVQNFNPTFNTPHRRNHSLNEPNQGLFSLPQEYDFEITVRPFGTGYEILTRCQHGDRYFDVSLQPITDFGVDTGVQNVGTPTGNWGPNVIVMRGCKINTRDERYSYTDQPTVTFSCFALDVMEDLIGNSTAEGPYGHGKGETQSDAKLGLDKYTSTSP